MNHVRHTLSTILLVNIVFLEVFLPSALADNLDFSGSLSSEIRVFPKNPQFSDQTNITFSPSVVLQPEVVYEWNGQRDRMTLQPFFRWDSHDDNRTHGDLREANWLHQEDDWDVIIGISKIFWGVTESRHLVDIINQTDRVEDIDNEDKLGQPMLNLNVIDDWGTFGLFILPGFRERTFPDRDARLRGPSPVDVDNPSFEASAKQWHVDFAARWAHTLEAWDLGVAHFYGTSREPNFLPRLNQNGQIVFIPRYDLIHQSSVDLQYTDDAWLWKVEAIMRHGHGDRFFATVAGFEYSLYQVFQSQADLGLLVEYQYDGREAIKAPPTINDDDFFIGTRLTMNDEQNSTLLLGATIDRTWGTTLLFIEAERRLSNHWQLEIESRLLPHTSRKDFASGFRDDGFITARLNYFF